MRALIFSGDDCFLGDQPMPIPREEEVLIRVSSAILLRHEVIFTAHNSTPRINGTPLSTQRLSNSVPGRILQGSVVAQGSEVTNSFSGPIFAWLEEDGGATAEFCVAHSAFVFPCTLIQHEGVSIGNWKFHMEAVKFIFRMQALYYLRYLPLPRPSSPSGSFRGGPTRMTVALFGAESFLGQEIWSELVERRTDLDVVAFSSSNDHSAAQTTPRGLLRNEHDPSFYCRAQVVFDCIGMDHLPALRPFVQFGAQIYICTTAQTLARHSPQPLSPEILQWCLEQNLTLHCRCLSLRNIDSRSRWEWRQQIEDIITHQPHDKTSVSTHDRAEIMEVPWTERGLIAAFQAIDQEENNHSAVKTQSLALSISAATTAVQELSQELDFLRRRHSSPPGRGRK